MRSVGLRSVGCSGLRLGYLRCGRLDRRRTTVGNAGGSIEVGKSHLLDAALRGVPWHRGVVTHTGLPVDLGALEPGVPRRPHRLGRLGQRGAAGRSLTEAETGAGGVPARSIDLPDGSVGDLLGRGVAQRDPASAREDQTEGDQCDEHDHRDDDADDDSGVHFYVLFS